MMRVLAFCDYFDPGALGGAERVAREIYDRLAATGVEVLVVGAVPGEPGRLGGGDPATGGYRVETLRGRDLTGLLGAQLMVAPGFARVGRRLVDEFRPDVVHVNGMHFHSTVTGVRVGRAKGIPIVATAHLGSVDAMPGRAAKASVLFDRVVGGRAACAADRVVAVSSSVRDHLVSLGVPSEKVTVVYNGVDHDRFTPADRAEGSGPLRIALVGRLVANKGPLLALDAFAAARTAGADVHLDIIGDGPLRDRVVQRIDADGLGGAVTMHGAVADVAPLLARADVLVRPSFSEGLPLAVLEAMASGVAIVCSDVGGNIEAVGGSENAVVVPTGDGDALRDAIVMLADRPEVVQRLATCGVRRAKSFDWDATADGHRAVFADVIAARDRFRLQTTGKGPS